MSEDLDSLAPLDSLALISRMEPLLRRSVDDALPAYDRFFLSDREMARHAQIVGRGIAEWAKINSLNNAEVCELCNDLHALQMAWAPAKIVSDGLSHCFQFLPEENIPIPSARMIVNRPGYSNSRKHRKQNPRKTSPKVAFTREQVSEETLWEGQPFGTFSFFPRAEFAVTASHASASKGYFFRTHAQIHLCDIRIVTVTPRNILFGTSDVTLNSGAGAEIIFENIVGGERVRELIRTRQSELCH